MPGDGERPAGVFWLTVSQISHAIKETLERSIGHVWVMGELTGVKHHQPSGHLYFGMRDADSLIRAVMFRRQASTLAFVPAEGEMVLAHGRVTTFERQGQYELIVDEMLPAGAKGLAALKLEMLKSKLAEEGLFDSGRKRPLPRFPSTVGVVTSSTGAAIADILKVITRRWPAVRILISPAIVQGEGAPASIVRALQLLDSSGLADVVIVGRGGGAREELSCFDDESVVRAIAATGIPVVSAVGHETDVTLADLVADARAPTPSAAADLVVPERRELALHGASLIRRAYRSLHSRIAVAGERVRRLNTSHGLRSPKHMVQQRVLRLDDLATRLRVAAATTLRGHAQTVRAQGARLAALNPRAVLSRGYTMCVDHQSGALVSTATCIVPSQVVDVIFSDGEATCQVMSTVTT